MSYGNQNSNRPSISSSSLADMNRKKQTNENNPDSINFFGLDHTKSNAISTDDLDDFENTTYSLKRTRSVGLLDNFIAPTKKLIEEDFSHTNYFASDPLNMKPKYSSKSNLNELNVPIQHQLSSNLGSFNNNSINHHSNISSLFQNESSDEESDEEDVMMISVPSKVADNNILSENVGKPSEEESASGVTSGSENTGQAEILQPHDDNDVTFEPKNRVDYFSYDWTDREILKSWRYVVDRKKTLDHAAKIENSRLENASWRTWARAKYALKTVTPESINWKKDTDVSWLYGPKCTPETESDVRNHLQEHKDRKGIKLEAINQSNNNFKGSNPNPSLLGLSTDDFDVDIIDSSNNDIINASEKSNAMITVKPILKVRKISEKINANADLFKMNILNEKNRYHSGKKSSVNSPILEAASGEHTPVSNSLSPSYGAHDARIKDITPMELDNDSNNLEDSIDRLATEERPLLKSSFLVNPATKSETDAKRSRQIHFNDRVDQCRIVDYYSDSETERQNIAADNDDGSDIALDSDSDSDNGLVLSVPSDVHRRSSESTSLTSSHLSIANNKTTLPKIIEYLPATKIRFRDEESSEESEFESEDEENYSWVNDPENIQPSFTSNNSNSSLNNTFPAGSNYGLMKNNKNAISHNTNTNRGYEFYYDYNSVYVPEDLLLSHDNSEIMEDVPQDLALEAGEPSTSSNNGEGFVLTGDEALSLSSEDTNSYSGLSFGGNNIHGLKNYHQHLNSNNNSNSLNNGSVSELTERPTSSGSAATLTKKPSSASNLSSGIFNTSDSQRNLTLLSKSNSLASMDDSKPKFSLVDEDGSSDEDEGINFGSTRSSSMIPPPRQPFSFVENSSININDKVNFEEEEDDESSDDEQDFFNFSKRNSSTSSNRINFSPNFNKIANNKSPSIKDITGGEISAGGETVSPSTSSLQISDVRVNGFIENNQTSAKPKLSDLNDHI